jgi:RNA polymerase sigma factor (sigma-70 family)
MHAIATGNNALVLRPRSRLPARLLRLARDERLVEQVRAGSVAAFDVVYDRHHRGVLAFCRHMLGSKEEAEDAVQHTFMAAYRALAGSGQRIELRPWLYAVARNRCLTVLRSRREQPVGELAEPATENLAVQVQQREDLRELLRDLGGLPEQQRAALVLAELGDVSHDEIAQVLGCERGKVKALVFQARSSLYASRAARETSCVQIREQLANLHGGALRRNMLRRHLRECPGCREFRSRVRAQRRALAIVLPVAPSVGLKEGVLGSALGGASVAGTAGLAGGAGTLAAKALVVATVAGGGATAGVETIRDAPAPEPATAPPAAATTRAAAPAASRPLVIPVATVPKSAARPHRTIAGRSRVAQSGGPAGVEQRRQAGEHARPQDHQRPAPAPTPAPEPQHHSTKPPGAAAPPVHVEVEKEPVSTPAPTPTPTPAPPAPTPTPSPVPVEPEPTPQPTPEPVPGDGGQPVEPDPVGEEPPTGGAGDGG